MPRPKHMESEWTFGDFLVLPIWLTAATFQYSMQLYARWRGYPEVTKINGDISKPCRFRLDDETSTTMTLPDGRKLGYAEWGSKTGKPIICLHGLPGARTEGALWHDLGIELNARLICPDRPGIGQSTSQPYRTILDHAEDVKYLAEHLKLDEYAVMGTSGGGPYAMACAYSLPAKNLKSVACVVGVGPADIKPIGQNWSNYLGHRYLSHYCPGLTRWWIQLTWPAVQFHLSDKERFELMRQDAASQHHHPKDEMAFDIDYIRLFCRTSKEHFRQGFGAFLQEARIMGSKWSFRIEDIRKDLPIFLWYGKQDHFVPPAYGEEMFKRLKGNEKAKLRIEDETHQSLVINWEREIMKQLVDCL